MPYRQQQYHSGCKSESKAVHSRLPTLIRAMDSLRSSSTTQPLILMGIKVPAGLDCGIHVTVSPTAICFAIRMPICDRILRRSPLGVMCGRPRVGKESMRRRLRTQIELCLGFLYPEHLVRCGMDFPNVLSELFQNISDNHHLH